MLKTIAESETPVEWVVIDVSPINILDVTAIQKIDELREELATQGIVLARARAKESLARFFSGGWAKEKMGANREYNFPTVRSALEAFQKRPKRSETTDS